MHFVLFVTFYVCFVRGEVLCERQARIRVDSFELLLWIIVNALTEEKSKTRCLLVNAYARQIYLGFFNSLHVQLTIYS